MARLVVAGLVGRPDRDEDRALARRAPYRASPMTAESYEELRTRLGEAGRRAVLAAAVPEDPTGLWRPGGVEAAVERMAGAWAERLGARPAVHDEAADALEAGLGLSEVWARRLRGGYGAADDTTVPAAGWELAAASYGSEVEVRALPPAGTEPPCGTPVGLDLGRIASALVWAWTDRPVGDPAVAGAPALYERLRAELDRPELLVRLAHGRIDDAPERIAERFGPDGSPWPGTGARRGPGPGDRLRLRPARGVRAGRRRLPAPRRGRRPRGAARGPRAHRPRRGTGPAGTAARGRRPRPDDAPGLSGAVPEGAYEADPRQSCPELVARVAEHLGVSADAAALHLQTAALAAPTDRNVRRWNGWTTRRHAEVRAELLATGAVVEAKRPRAGRTLFLPGEWTELKAPHLPLETVKLTSHRVRPLWGDRILSPFDRVLPTAPLHELFEEAWERASGRGLPVR